MKRTCTILAIVLCMGCLTTHAQDYPIELPAFNIAGFDKYTIKAEVIDYYVYKYTLEITGNDTDKQEFILRPNDPGTFRKSFRKNFADLATADTDDEVKSFIKNDTLTTREADRLFALFIASERTVQGFDNTPKAGTLCVSKEINIEKSLLADAVKWSLVRKKFKDFKIKYKTIKKEYIRKKPAGQDTSVTMSPKRDSLGRSSAGQDRPGTRSEFRRSLIPVSINIKDPIHYITPPQLRSETAREYWKQENEKLNYTETVRVFKGKRLLFFFKKWYMAGGIYMSTKDFKNHIGKKFGDVRRQSMERMFSDVESEYNSRSAHLRDTLLSISRYLRIPLRCETSIRNLSLAIKVRKKELTEDSILYKAKIEYFRRDSIDSYLDHFDIATRGGRKPEGYPAMSSRYTQNISTPDLHIPLDTASKDQLKSFYDSTRPVIAQRIAQEKDYLESTHKGIRYWRAAYGEASETLKLLEDSLKNRALSDRKKRIINSEIQLVRKDMALFKRLFDDTAKTNYEVRKTMERIEVLKKTDENIKKDLFLLIDSAKRIDDSLAFCRLIVTDSIKRWVSQRNDLANDLLMLQQYRVSRKFRIERVQIEFNEGFIENILVTGHTIKVNKDSCDLLSKYDYTKDWFLKFENRFPLGFSTKRDFEKMKDNKLYTYGGDYEQFYMKVEDLFDNLDGFVQEHMVDRRDFSPRNAVETWDFTKADDACKLLHKEESFKLLEAKVFSDFVGLDETNPNGLIQTEIDRKLNLITRRHPRKFFVNDLINWGFLAFVHPVVTLSKLEKNNRELLISTRDRFVNNQYVAEKYASTLEIKRFENFSTGFELNLVLLDIPSFKSTFYLNAGIKYGRTAIRDSVRVLKDNVPTNNGFTEEYGVNTYQAFPKLIWEVKTDERYCFVLSLSPNWYFLRSNKFEQVDNTDHYAQGGERSAKNYCLYNNVQLMLSFRPNASATGKLFFRYQFNWQQGYWLTGFHQAQVGYSFFLTRPLKKTTAGS